MVQYKGREANVACRKAVTFPVLPSLGTHAGRSPEIEVTSSLSISLGFQTNHTGHFYLYSLLSEM
jgi:hypothetical protein